MTVVVQVAIHGKHSAVNRLINAVDSIWLENLIVQFQTVRALMMVRLFPAFFSLFYNISGYAFNLFFIQ